VATRAARSAPSPGVLEIGAQFVSAATAEPRLAAAVIEGVEQLKRN